MIHINLFGKFQIIDETGQALPVTGAKTQGMIAYLALNMEMPPSRDRLMSLFWGDRFTDQARQSLRQAIAKLKRQFGDIHEDAILADLDRVGLNPERFRVDAEEFAELAQEESQDAVQKAVNMLSGAFLEGFYGQQSEFENWLASERQRLATLSMQVMERAAEQAMMSGDPNTAIMHARRLVGIDPLRDASQSVLIRILAQQGERSAAVQQFQAYETMLKKELGVGVGSDLQRLMQEVRSEGSFFDLPAEEITPTQKTAPEKPGLVSGRTSIAVVPFTSITHDAEHTIFAESLTEDLTTNLSRFSWLSVKASVESTGNRLTSGQMNVLAQDLQLDYVLHGSIRCSGNRVRLTVQIAEPKSGRFVWVTRYDRETEDLFDLQDDLADTIIGSVEAELQRLAGRGSREIDFERMSAWDCYHRGLAIQYEFDAKTNELAEVHFRRSIELDPNFGLAYARLSYAIVISTIYFEAPDVDKLLDEALELAKTASRLDPDDAVVRFALGRVYLAQGEYERSISDLQAAIDLNPGLAQAHCGLGDSKAYSGQLDEAISCFEEAVRISPADPYRWAFLSYGATAFLFRGDYQNAADWAQEAERVPNAHYWPTAIKASALAHAGDAKGASEAVEDLKLMRPGITNEFVRSRLFYLRDPDQIDTYVSGLQKAGLE